MPCCARVLVCLAACVWPSAAASQTSTTADTQRISETVVVSATVTPVPLGSVSRTITLLPREELERLGITALADALRLVPGLDVRARGPWDVQTDFSLRGATFGQALVLVDGIRLNDSQSGHHNGDLPIALLGLERVEVVNGAGSAVHGADALGGAINFITRRDAHALGSVSAGQFGYVAAQGSVSGVALPPGWSATGWASRSGGFMFDRDFTIGGGALRGPVAEGWTVDVRHQRKAFGANGFYGNSPSKEWTDQTLVATSWTAVDGRWTTEVRTAYRNHGDHFRWDINRPGFAENRHRTDALDAQVVARGDLGAGRRLALGGGVGGDWIESSNLGDRAYRRTNVFAELQLPLADRTLAQIGLRLDDYSRFGQSTNPSASVSHWLTDRFRIRTSVAHAFRVPTFTELYYTDPAHRASDDLVAERGWTLDAGLDWMSGPWTVAVTPFARWDEDVIDWVREAPTDFWRTTNVRDVTSTGLELSLTRRLGTALLSGRYTGVRVDAPTLNLLSKYVKEYVPHSVGFSAATPLGRGLHGGLTVDVRRRLSAGRTDTYTLVGVRLSRRLGRVEVFVNATNLLNEIYQEISGVAMPGRWATAGVTIR